jgi:uridine phosphorylase
MEPSSAPILEFDPTPAALIEPSLVYRKLDVPEHCVLCFFKEVIDKVAQVNSATIHATHHWEDGLHHLYEIQYQGQRLAFMHPGVGAPLAAGILEDAIARGCRKFIVCGGAGVLTKGIGVGSLFVVSSAVRDEGVSYHYLPAAREVNANPLAAAALGATLKARRLPYSTGKTWTTDAPYRETSARIALRRDEGCLTVEMEAAAFMAVAEFRQVVLGQLLYGGDDLSGDRWDERGWTTLHGLRENLFWLAAQACLSL